MPRPRKLSDSEIADICDWGKRYKALETRKQIAHRLNVSECTIDRIVRDGGYKTESRKTSIGILMDEILGPRETNFSAQNSGAIDPL